MKTKARGQHADDDLDRVFPGRRLIHSLTIRSENLLAVSIEALRIIEEAGGALDALSFVRRDDSLEHRLRLVGLRPSQARVLADRLADLPGVAQVSLEHQLLKL